MNADIDRLCAVIAESLGIARDQVTPSTAKHTDLDAWNSIGHLQIVLGVEAAYGVPIRYRRDALAGQRSNGAIALELEHRQLTT